MHGIVVGQRFKSWFFCCVLVKIWDSQIVQQSFCLSVLVPYCGAVYRSILYVHNATVYGLSEGIVFESSQ